MSASRVATLDNHTSFGRADLPPGGQQVKGVLKRSSGLLAGSKRPGDEIHDHVASGGVVDAAGPLPGKARDNAQNTGVSELDGGHERRQMECAGDMPEAEEQ
jgi:hypothetical protein